MRKRSLLLVLFLCVATVAMLIQPTEAPAASIVSSGSWSLGNGQQETVFSDVSVTTVSSTLAVTAGTVQVRGTNGGGTSVLATISSGTTMVFEGGYSEMKVVAQGGGSTGTWQSRSPSDDSGNTNIDVGLVGSLSVSGTTQIYWGDVARERAIALTCSSGSVTLRTSSGGGDLASADAGEGLYLYDVACSAWYVVGTGTISFDIHQVNSTTQKTTETTKKSSGQNSTDVVTLDGEMCITGKIKNTGTGKIHVRTTYKNGTKSPPDAGTPPTPQTEELDPGEEHLFTCFVTQFFIQYDNGNGKATITSTPVAGS